MVQIGKAIGIRVGTELPNGNRNQSSSPGAVNIEELKDN